MPNLKALKSLTNPDQVGSAEYRAIYELLEDAESEDHAVAVLDEFVEWATRIREKIKQPHD